MKRAVVTIACGRFYDQMALLTHPLIQDYAQRVGARFIVWKDYPGHRMPHYRKLELAQVLDDFDRVLYVDTDILVRDDAPDIFELVPEGQLGILDESPYHDRNRPMQQMFKQRELDPASWDGHYYNTGVMVLSQVHKKLFVPPKFEWDNFKEQTYLNSLFSEQKPPIFQLPRRFNRLYVMDTYYGEQRFDAWFLHYAGINEIMSETEQLELMQHDLDVWRANRPVYHFPKTQ